MKKKPLGYYDYTVILTYCGMLFAFLGIFRAVQQDYDAAVFCLMAAGLCDMFDGAVAGTKARTQKEKRFGVQIDSLSDLIGFGVLPGIFVYMICEQKAAVGAVAAAFTLCALIRLAYFNVQEEERQQRTEEKRRSYLGVPVTTIALLLPAVYLLYHCQVCRRAVYFPVLLSTVGVGYLSPVEIKKPGLAGKLGILLVGAAEAVCLWRFRGFGVM